MSCVMIETMSEPFNALAIARQRIDEEAERRPTDHIGAYGIGSYGDITE